MALSRVASKLVSKTLHGYIISTRSLFWTSKQVDSDKSISDRIESTLEKIEQAALEMRKLHKDHKQLKDSDVVDINELSKMQDWYFQEKRERKGCEFPFEDEENRYFKIDMPGIGKKGLRVWLKDDELHIRGEELWNGTESNHENGLRIFSGSFCLDSSFYQSDKIRVQIKNGVLRIVIPKMKNEN